MVNEQTHQHDNRNCPGPPKLVLYFLHSSAAVCNARTNGNSVGWSGRIFGRVDFSAARDTVWLGRPETPAFEELTTGLLASLDVSNGFSSKPFGG